MSIIKKLEQLNFTGHALLREDRMMEIFGDDFNNKVLHVPNRYPSLLFEDEGSLYRIDYIRSKNDDDEYYYKLLENGNNKGKSYYHKTIISSDLKIYLKQAEYHQNQLNLFNSVFNHEKCRIKKQLI